MSPQPLALHHFTLCDVSPLELVSIAAEVGCDGVCLFVESPPGFGFPLVTPALRSDLLARLREHEVRVTNLEFFSLTEAVDLDGFRPALALGAQLGARLAVTHIHDPDPLRGTDCLGRLAELAGEYGLQLGLEFMALTPGCTSLAAAAGFVERVGRSNLGIGVDALHLARTGGTPAEVAALAPGMVAYAQLCDGPLLAAGVDALDPARYAEEAFNRLPPGQGVFPLAELIRALPPTAALDVEVPMPRLAAQGVSALQRARLAVAGARSLLDAQASQTINQPQ
ncbi:Sugar phosphate isomerase/epimerase [Pseudomonas linyingensis]|uniref:Sugar phosphate isomerase/epimerase n=1 Tax=Pseudomonas linyingensis TaxID=915471 RepID=A0A1H7BGD9_9PSED|nr:sugar phosphate isomerase/epimerase family protein [Pseudomonas linyingensis]SEJ76691.1 Sugar phosphate isomerase/epimerase [Pseudomonas linyingensis]